MEEDNSCFMGPMLVQILKWRVVELLLVVLLYATTKLSFENFSAGCDTTCVARGHLKEKHNYVCKHVNI